MPTEQQQELRRQCEAVLVTSRLKGEIDESTIIVGDLNTPFLAIDRITKQKTALAILDPLYFSYKF